MKNNRMNLESLISLRFFAVMLIVIHHLRYLFIPNLLKNENFGTLGVTFFLILSGFVISLTYRRFTRIADSFYFLWNRIVRIYPLHIIAFFICLLIFSLRGFPIDLSTAIINSMLLQSYFPSKDIYFSFNSLSWMLSTLFFFYIVFSIANHRPRFFLWLYLISLISLLLSMTYIEVNQKGDDLWFRLWLLYIFPPNKLVVILLGVGTSKIFLKYLNQLKGWIGKTQGTLLEIIVLLLTIDFIVWGNITKFTQSILLFIHTPFVKSLELMNANYISAPIISLLVISVFAVEKGIIAQFLKTRPLLFLGEISFSIFISHQLFINYVLDYYKNSLFYTFGQPITIIISMVLIILLSSLIYIFIEDPVRKKLRIRTHWSIIRWTICLKQLTHWEQTLYSGYRYREHFSCTWSLRGSR